MAAQLALVLDICTIPIGDMNMPAIMSESNRESAAASVRDSDDGLDRTRPKHAPHTKACRGAHASAFAYEAACVICDRQVPAHNEHMRSSS